MLTLSTILILAGATFFVVRNIANKRAERELFASYAENYFGLEIRAMRADATSPTRFVLIGKQFHSRDSAQPTQEVAFTLEQTNKTAVVNKWCEAFNITPPTHFYKTFATLVEGGIR